MSALEYDPLGHVAAYAEAEERADAGDEKSAAQKRWEAMIDQETQALRAEAEATVAGMSEAEIAERAAAAIKKYGGQ